MWDDELRTLVNDQGEIKVGNSYYRFLTDGTHYTYEPDPGDPRDPPLEELSGALQPVQSPSAEDEANAAALLFPTCKSWRRAKGEEYSGDGKWRAKYKLSFFNSRLGYGGKAKVI